MPQHTSIGQWFKRTFSGPASTDAPRDVAVETDDEKTIDEARIDAGGNAAAGVPNAPDTHASPAEEVARDEGMGD